MSLAKCLSQVSKVNVVTFSRSLFTVGKGMQEMTSKDIPITSERFGNSKGESGWEWKNIDGVEAVGMGGKTADLATGKSLSEALIFASTNPQFDDRLFIEL